MSDPLLLLDSWPSLGPDRHSESAKQSHEWFRMLAMHINNLQTEIKTLRAANVELEKKLNNQQKSFATRRARRLIAARL